MIHIVCRRLIIAALSLLNLFVLQEAHAGASDQQAPYVSTVGPSDTPPSPRDAAVSFTVTKIDSTLLSTYEIDFNIKLKSGLQHSSVSTGHRYLFALADAYEGRVYRGELWTSRDTDIHSRRNVDTYCEWPMHLATQISLSCVQNFWLDNSDTKWVDITSATNINKKLRLSCKGLTVEGVLRVELPKCIMRLTAEEKARLEEEDRARLEREEAYDE